MFIWKNQFQGSLALARGFQVSGLSDWIGDQLKSLDFNSKELTSVFLQVMTQIFTEFASNASVEGKMASAEPMNLL
jgi:hypothetical protein